MKLMDRLARLEAAHRAATPGEWRLQEDPKREGGRPFAIVGGDREHGFPFKVPVAYAALYVDHTVPQRVQRDVTRANAAFILVAHAEAPGIAQGVLELADLAFAAAVHLKDNPSPEAQALAKQILDAVAPPSPASGSPANTCADKSS